MTPTIKTTKTGKRYFVVNGQKVFITKKMTKKEISSIYRLLKKRASLFPVKKKKTNNSNKISINIDNSSKRQRAPHRSEKKSNFVSTIDPANRVTKSSGVNALDQDLMNSSINKANKLLTMMQGEKKQQNQEPNENERRMTLFDDLMFFASNLPKNPNPNPNPKNPESESDESEDDEQENKNFPMALYSYDQENAPENLDVEDEPYVRTPTRQSSEPEEERVEKAKEEGSEKEEEGSEKEKKQEQKISSEEKGVERKPKIYPNILENPEIQFPIPILREMIKEFRSGLNVEKLTDIPPGQKTYKWKFFKNRLIEELISPMDK